ncbi:MAG TPA: aldehyde dehydrogenase family protein [Armatimonadota bacterium]|jgi:acyl-CoA reductase-like NAD-dependent aldehyde dehydrogenase
MTVRTKSHYGLFIDNQWIETAQSFASLNPATEEPFARFPSATPEDVDRAVLAARRAFDCGTWSGMAALERGRLLRRAAELLRARTEEFAQAETQDTGKPIFESRNVDIPAAADSLEYYGSLVVDLLGESIPVGSAALDYTVREPIGVVAAIVPWNFPLVLACRKLAPALAAGNTVVIKPASLAPLTTVMLGEIFLDAGFPAGVVNIITGSGSVAGDALLRHPAVDKLSFTGSTEIGRSVLAASCEQICACSLELGGKSPAVVLADAPLEQTADGILFGAFLNQGECCCAATRVLVDQRVHAPLVEMLVEKTRRIVLGDGREETSRMGPLISAEHRRTIMDFVQSGIAEAGAPVVGGGIPAGFPRGYYFEPTIFDHVPVNSRIYREEVFGPVLTVTAFDGEDALVAAANDTPYGLAASIWTGNAAVGQRLAPRIKAGTVWVNIHNFLFAQAPYGGFKQSGIGRELGREGLDMYTEVKNVITWLAPDGFRWY